MNGAKKKRILAPCAFFAQIARAPQGMAPAAASTGSAGLSAGAAAAPLLRA